MAVRELGKWADVLMTDRAALDRGSTVERVADILRGRITEGLFPPGRRLSEEEPVPRLATEYPERGRLTARSRPVGPLLVAFLRAIQLATARAMAMAMIAVTAA